MNALTESRVLAQWVMENARVAVQQQDGDICKLVLESPEIARRAVPGQFVQVHPVPRDRAGADPLLRRPLSLCEIQPEAGRISLIYQVVGKGTRLLAAARPGDVLDLIGPLGHSYPDPRAGRGPLVLVGGGLGIPPLAAAARWAAPFREVSALVGARTAHYLAGAAELAEAGVPVMAITEDGSAGERGLVTEPLERLVEAGQVGEVWACGPQAMLAAVKEICLAGGVPCFVSVDKHMACGFGACLGCAIPKAGAPGYWRSCQEGPVFPAEEVDLRGR